MIAAPDLAESPRFATERMASAFNAHFHQIGSCRPLCGREASDDCLSFVDSSRPRPHEIAIIWDLVRFVARANYGMCQRGLPQWRG